MNDLVSDKNRRILVVDDNREIHDDFRKILSADKTAVMALDASEAALFGSPSRAKGQTRFWVESAFQGEEGVLMVKSALAAGRPYAMAFVDVRMPPGMDGVETTKKIWAIDSEIQIVLCTAYSDASWDQILGTIGETDRMLILKKPFDAVEVLQLAQALTEKWWLRRQARWKVEELESMIAERTRELRQSNDTLQMQSRVIESMTEAVIVADEHGKIVATNPACNQMFGYARGELTGRHVSILRNLDEAESRRAVTETTASITPGLNWLGEIDQRRKDGSAFTARAQIGKFEMAGQSHFFSVKEDITERKRIEAKLIQSQKLESVARLSGGIAHEFNSILTVIIGQSDLLLSQLLPGDALRANAADIQKAAWRATTLTQQLLAYGRKQILQPEILDLNTILAGLEGGLSHLLARGTKVRLLQTAGLNLVKADAGQLEHVLMNMVMNAADAMPNGGELSLETANVSFSAENPGRPPELKPGGYVLLGITDTGVGMSEEVKRRLFEPFFTTKGVGEGTGLGLAACHGIIKQSGGHLTVESEPGRGSTFKIYLPQSESPATIALPSSSSTALTSSFS